MTSETTAADELVAEYLSAAERGQAPDAADWLASHPEHAAELAAFLADLGLFASFLGLSEVTDPDLTQVRDDSSAKAPPTAVPTEGFGGYEVLGEIGRGAQGSVFRARVKGTSLEVALKQLHAADEHHARRFREEVEAAAGLRHPNIVPVYHVGEQDGCPFYTMALVSGGALDRHLARFRDAPRATAVLVAKVARAVHFAHQRRLLHRDLKPANILLDESGEPQVADFGLAARINESGATTGAGTAGSLPWMAPEAVRGDPLLTTGVDVWAIGVILYELLTGERPFRGNTGSEMRAAILSHDPPPPRLVNPRVPLDLDAICRRCLAREPDKRYESASAVALDLERWLRDEPVRARPAGRGERFARWCRRNPGLAAAGVFGIALLVALSAVAATAIGEWEGGVVSDVCQNSEYDATQVAGNVLERFKQLGSAVEEKTKVLAKGDEFPAGNKPAAEKALSDLVQTPVGGQNAPPFVNAFLLDSSGHIQAIWPPDPKAHPPDVFAQSFADRDYFVRAQPKRVHVSRVYPSRRDGLDKLALSIRFRLGNKDEWDRPPKPNEEWVLAATVTTDRKLDLGVVSMSDTRHEAILVAPRDSAPLNPGESQPDEYVILVHQALDPRSPTRRFGTGVPGAPRANGLPELGTPPKGEGRPFLPDPGYRDPFGAVDSAYAGRWLTGSARVGNTELVVVVQQRYADAVTRHRSLMRRALAWLGTAVAVGLVAFVGLRLMRTRSLGEGWA